MKQDLMRVGVGITVAAALAMIAAPRARADAWNKLTIVTFNEPMQVGDTYLDPGTYVFKLPGTDRHIVQIYNRDENHLINTIFAIPNYRPYRVPNTTFTYWETPPGTVRAMRAWFFPDDYYGQEFRYPTHLRQVAAVTAPAPALTPPAPETAPQLEVPPPAPAPEPAPPIAEQPPPAPQEPEQLTQNNPPPAPAAQPAPAPEETPQPTELPHTASPYPLIGLGGLLAAGLYALLRIKHASNINN